MLFRLGKETSFGKLGGIAPQPHAVNYPELPDPPFSHSMSRGHRREIPGLIRLTALGFLPTTRPSRWETPSLNTDKTEPNTPQRHYEQAPSPI